MKKILGLLPLLLVFQVQAAKLDLKMHNQLIDKLDSVVSLSAEEGKDQMVAKPQILLRLGDLLSERSRMLSVQNGGKGDVENREQIQSDRRRALELYKRAYPALDTETKGRTDLQSAHLHLMLKQKSEAVSFLNKLAATKSSENAVYRAQAIIQLGDLSFAQGDFAQAAKHFLRALDVNENPRVSYTYSRLAWCRLNQGRYAEAERSLIELLSTPALFKTANGEIDTPFQEETSRDLATFMARNDVNEDKIQTLIRLSPKNVQQSNLIYLATELDRTSKKRSALMVWAHIDMKAISFMDGVEKQIHIARIQYDLGIKPKTVIEIRKAAVLVSDRRCQKEEECKVFQQNLRSILTDWGKAEEREPSPELIRGYAEYLAFFEDFEVAYWAGNAATKRKQFIDAYKMYRLASMSQILRKKMEGKPSEHERKIFDGSLLAMIESAESSNDKNLQLEAYQHYLSSNPNGPKAWEVRYQMARLYYDVNKYNESSPLFRQIALSKGAPADLQNKSADLYFDTLAIQKDDAKIESEALIFSQSLTAKREQFHSLYRKSVLNQAAAVLKNQQSSEGALSSQHQKLSQIPLSTWPEADRKKLIRNRLLLAYRLKDLPAVENSSRELLAQKGLTVEEKNEALSTMAWSQEMRFQFRASLATLQRVTPDKKDLADHYFKLALLSELSQKNPTQYYEKVLTLSKGNVQGQFAAHQMVLASSRPARVFTVYYNVLVRNPQLFGSATAYVFEKEPNSSIVRRALGQPSLLRSSEGNLILGAARMNDLKRAQSQFRANPLRGSDANIKNALNAKVRAMNAMESTVHQGIREKNLTLQFIGLAEVAEANERLARDILAMPLPRGMKPNQREFYQQQVQQQVAPYQNKALAVRAKASELWKQQMEKDYLRDLVTWSEQRSRPGSKMAQQEVALLKYSVQKVGLSTDAFTNFTDQRHKVASEAQDVQERLQKNPFDSRDLQKLKQLQTQLGSGPMVAYLNTRITQPNQGGRN